ncbi:MAG: nucleoside-diphosphate sugar epimerase/dehydratase [Sulfuricurvum sp.]|jgi:UDP-N-acetyl-D-glucosamine 4,6-dehydratase
MQKKVGFLAPSFVKRVLFFLIADSILFFGSLRFAYELRFDFDIPFDHLANFYTVLFTLTLLKIGSFYLFGIYRLTWQFFSLQDAKKLFYAHLLSFTLFFILFWLNSSLFLPMPRSVIGIDFILSLVVVGTLRLSKRLILEQTHNVGHNPTLIVGISNHTGNLIKSTLENSNDYYPLAILALQEKNHNMIGSTIQNLKIIGVEKLQETIKTHHITTAIIDGSLSDTYLREAYQLLSDAGIQEIKRSRLLDESHNTIESLSLEELLARHPKDLDQKTIGTFIEGKTVVITGAGGSIGSEIALQCHTFGAKALILIDNSEYNLYQIGEKLPSASLHLTNILDRKALDTIIGSSKPDILIHAAAYKHVPLCEANIHAAITNNIIGSRNVIDSAISHAVSKIVIISTDKAVRPTNIMGATKRIVELYAQNVDPKESEIVSVRFVNVLGSSGSVIPKFKAQIDSGGPITLTHPDITRYFMLIGEACQLVLQAAAIARGGELFILDMGEPIKIIDLARTMIRLYATKPIEIVMSGLRPGEKLYEELLIDESEQKTVFESIFIARSSPYPIEKLCDDIEALEESNTPVEALQKIVPEFKPSGK